MIRETQNAEETFALARTLGEAAAPGEVYALDGDLGTGKTVFCQGFAEGLGVEEAVNSPTFTIVQEYGCGRLPLYHFDVYRIEDPEELFEVGFEEYLYGDGVCLIEWAERVPELLPACTRYVHIEKDMERGEDYRRIRLEACSDKEGFLR